MIAEEKIQLMRLVLELDAAYRLSRDPDRLQKAIGDVIIWAEKQIVDEEELWRRIEITIRSREPLNNYGGGPGGF